MHFKMSSAICFNLDLPKILSSGKGLNCGIDRSSGLKEAPANLKCPIALRIAAESR